MSQGTPKRAAISLPDFCEQAAEIPMGLVDGQGSVLDLATQPLIMVRGVSRSWPIPIEAAAHRQMTPWLGHSVRSVMM